MHFLPTQKSVMGKVMTGANCEINSRTRKLPNRNTHIHWTYRACPRASNGESLSVCNRVDTAKTTIAHYHLDGKPQITHSRRLCIVYYCTNNPQFDDQLLISTADFPSWSAQLNLAADDQWFF